MIAFSIRLKQIRKANKKKQSDVAEYLEIKTRSYQAYEGGEREPGIPKLIALANFFDVTLDYLLGRTDENP